jgi:hypothetical protein
MINKWIAWKILEMAFVKNYNIHLNNNLLLTVVISLDGFKVYIIKGKKYRKYNVHLLSCMHINNHRDEIVPKYN